jgi:autotransporter-associated beta strand protein
VANNGTGTGTLTLGALNDAGTARNFTKAGAGSLVLGSAATSLVAGTQVNVTGGVLTLNNATSIGNTAQLNAAASTVVNFNASATVAALTGAGSANIGANTLTIGNASNLSGAFSGVIAGAGGSIVKAGSGTLTLAGANTYSGTTSVNAGTLVVNNTTGAGTGSGITSLASGTTLMGTGRLGGGLTVNTGAFLAPGNSIGTLSANAGTTTLAAGGTYTVEYDHSGGVLTPGTTIDYFNSAGSLSVTAGNTAGNTFIINLKYTGPVGGGFSSPVSVNIATFGAGTTGSGFASDRFTITGDIVGSASTLTMDASNNLVLTFTPVPEPVTVLGLAAGAIGLAGFARRRYFRAA